MAIKKLPPLRIPSGWKDQARSFVIQLQQTIDDLYQKIGKKSGGGGSGVDDVKYSSKTLVKTVGGEDETIATLATMKSDMNLSKGDVGLGNVENKSAATILGEMTSGNVTGALGYTPLDADEKGAASGVAELDENGIVISAQLPSYVDDVLEYEDTDHFPLSGETGKIYVALDTNLTYRWSGSAYVEISPSLALGETSSTAYRGDRGADAYAHAVTNKGSAFASGLYKITTNSEGHVTAASAAGRTDIAATGILHNGTDYNTAGHYALDAATGYILGQDYIKAIKSQAYVAVQRGADYKLPSGDNAAAGDFIIKAGILGRATDTITSEVTAIVEGTNWEKVEIGGYNALLGDLADKADKVTGGTSGNFASLDVNGNLADSGHKHSDYITSHQDISGKADKVSDATSGNFAGLDSNGNLTDSGKKASDFLETGAIDDTAGGGNTDKTWSADKLSDENTLTKTIDTPASIQTFNDGAAWPMEMEIAIEPVQSGTGDPSPGNVRPITGWDGANVNVNSKNLLSFNSVSLNKDSHRTQTELISKIPAGTYIFSWEGSATYSTNVCFREQGSTENIAIVNVYTAEEHSVEIELTKDVETLYMFISNNAQSGATAELSSMMVRLSSDSDNAYRAYQRTVYPISFPSTCYGGTLTVNADGTGTLVVTNGRVDLGTKTWTEDGQDGRYYSNGISDIKKVSSFANGKMICTIYPYSSAAKGDMPDKTIRYNALNSNQIFVKDSAYTDATTFTTAMSGVYLVYELDTPLVYTLSAPQVLSLLGQNNVWADCGNINSLAYVRRQDIGFIREDTAGQIRAMIDQVDTDRAAAEASIAIVVNGNTAPKNINKGQYLFIKNHSTLASGLYHATSAISSGGSISSSNVTADADGVANALDSKIENFLAGYRFTQFRGSGGETVTFTVPNSLRAWVLCNGGNSNMRGIFTFTTTSGGAPNQTVLGGSPSGYTFDNTTNNKIKVTFANPCECVIIHSADKQITVS